MTRRSGGALVRRTSFVVSLAPASCAQVRISLRLRLRSDASAHPNMPLAPLERDALIVSLRREVASAESRASAYAARYRTRTLEAVAWQAEAACARAEAGVATREAARYRSRFLAAIAALGVDECEFPGALVEKVEERCPLPR